MPVNSQNNQRIAKNTMLLYIRMLILMLINLYTSRVILKALGIEDYGIYTAVGGFVAMFGMISTALGGAISRYLTFSLAKDTPERLREIFSTSIIIQFALCVLLITIAETLGIWFINTQMDMPADRIVAANWVFQISVLTTIINLIGIPYQSLIIAHERMSTFAYIGIYEGLFNLSIAIILSYVVSFDALITYAILLCALAVSVRAIYGVYCSKNFPESSFKFIIDKELLKNMFSFAGWNFIGTTSGVLRSQGINVLINIFCGPAVNAARGIAMQVNGALSGFTGNFMTAVRPQITKSYALGNKDAYENLVFKSSKFSFFILMIIFLPLIIESKFIISAWLVEVPEYTIEFVQVILILTLVESYSHPLIYLLLSTGNIKKYQILVGVIQILNFPIAYVLLKLGLSPISTVTSAIFIAIICLFTRLWLLKNMINFPVKTFTTNVILRTAVLFIVNWGLFMIIKDVIALDGWTQFIINVISIETICITLIYIFGLTKSEKYFILSIIKKIIKR